MQRTRRNPDGGEHPSMAYQRIEREAREARDRAVTGLTGAERKAALRTARAEYDRVVSAAWDAYQRVIGNRRNPRSVRGTASKREVANVKALLAAYHSLRTPSHIWDEARHHLLLLGIDPATTKGRAKQNPVQAFLGYTGDDLHGHAIPWSREGHARIRAAIGRIDRARTHAEMFKAYSDALKVRYALEAKGLGSGRGYPVEWGNDIGSSYWAKYKELGPTEEDKIAAAYKAAQAAEKERARAKRKRNPHRRNSALTPAQADFAEAARRIELALRVNDKVSRYERDTAALIRLALKYVPATDHVWTRGAPSKYVPGSANNSDLAEALRKAGRQAEADAATGRVGPTLSAHARAIGAGNDYRRRNSDDGSISVGERVRVLTGDYYDQRSKKQIHHDGLYVVGVVASVTKGGQYNVDLLNGHQLRARASAVSRTTRELTPAKPVRKSGLFR